MSSFVALSLRRNRGWPWPEESFGLTPMFGEDGWCRSCGVPRRPQTGNLVLQRKSFKVHGADAGARARRTGPRCAPPLVEVPEMEAYDVVASPEWFGDGLKAFREILVRCELAELVSGTSGACHRWCRVLLSC